MTTRGCTELPTSRERGCTAATAGFSCTPEECGDGRRVRGMCIPHYKRWHYRTPRHQRPRPMRSETAYDALAGLTVQMPGEDGCLVWRSGQRYPTIYYRTSCYKAHHLAWVLHNGMDVPAGKMVLHLCDNPSCLRGDHLVIGTAKINTQHIACRGRWGKRIKLSREKAAYIRRCGRGVRTRDLADQFGVTRQTINDVLRGKTWTTECT